jgi:hypothetical protein
MKTFEFTTVFEIAGFEDPQEAGEWLEKQLTRLADDSPTTVIDFDIDTDVRVITYTAQ